MKRPKTGGRKKGTPNKLTQETVAVAAKEGITPLEVLLKSMRIAWEANNIERACAFADKAAPYVHPKLSSVDAKIEGEGKLIIEHVTFSGAA